MIDKQTNNIKQPGHPAYNKYDMNGLEVQI
jgi:hypothetical protein